MGNFFVARPASKNSVKLLSMNLRMLKSNPQPRKIEGMKSMKKKACLLTLTVFVCALSCENLWAQTEPVGTGNSRPTSTSITKQKPAESTPEEMVVRGAYEKLTKLNRAAAISTRRILT